MKFDWQPRALKIIFDYWKENRSYPSNVVMSELLDVDTNNWGNIRRAMINNGKLVRSDLWDFELPSGILEKLINNDKKVSAVSTGPIKSQVPILSTQLPNREYKKEQRVAPVSIKRSIEIPILGQVIAGTDRGPDDLTVDLSPSGETLLLPDIDDGQDVYVLEVQGRSMESDAILPNDYVIVERVPFIELKNNDLVVVKYLKEEFNFVDEEQFHTAITISENFMGPTLKYFHQIPVVVGKNKKSKNIEEIRFQLAPKNKYKRYTIVTRYIDPDDVGRVVSIHRTIRRL